MYILLRILTIAFFIWMVCYLFYSLGKKDALKGHMKQPRNKRRRSKVVESSVVEKGHADNEFDDKDSH